MMVHNRNPALHYEQYRPELTEKEGSHEQLFLLGSVSQ